MVYICKHINEAQVSVGGAELNLWQKSSTAKTYGCQADIGNTEEGGSTDGIKTLRTRAREGGERGGSTGRKPGGGGSLELSTRVDEHAQEEGNNVDNHCT